MSKLKGTKVGYLYVFEHDNRDEFIYYRCVSKLSECMMLWYNFDTDETFDWYVDKVSQYDFDGPGSIRKPTKEERIMYEYFESEYKRLKG